MPSTLAALPKGYEFPTTTFTLTPAWVDAYVEAVGDGAIKSVGPELVPPMAIAALSIRALITTVSQVWWWLAYCRTPTEISALSVTARRLSSVPIRV